jgi:hypothetical protein
MHIPLNKPFRICIRDFPKISEITDASLMLNDSRMLWTLFFSLDKSLTYASLALVRFLSYRSSLEKIREGSIMSFRQSSACHSESLRSVFFLVVCFIL